MEQVTTKNNNMARPTIDPVCGMKVEPGETRLVSVYQGHSYWFCAETCREAFERNPEKYLKPKVIKYNWSTGWLGRYLERMAKANKEHFGGRPSCH